jgi:hypothetical protein
MWMLRPSVVPFAPATQILASVVRSRKRQLSRAAEAFLREVRVVAGEINEKLVSRSLPPHLVRAEYLQGK